VHSTRIYVSYSAFPGTRVNCEYDCCPNRTRNTHGGAQVLSRAGGLVMVPPIRQGCRRRGRCGEEAYWSVKSMDTNPETKPGWATNPESLITYIYSDCCEQGEAPSPAYTIVRFIGRVNETSRTAGM